MDEGVHEWIMPLLNDTLSVISDKAIEWDEYARAYPNTTEFVSVLFLPTPDIQLRLSPYTVWQLSSSGS